MARRPAPRPTTTPLEQLRQLVDDHLADVPGRPPQRPSWEALDPEEQRRIVDTAMQGGPEVIRDWQAWIVGNSCKRPLVAEVSDVITAYHLQELR